MKAAAGWQPDCFDGDDEEYEDEEGEMLAGEEAEDDVVYWPHVPCAVAASRTPSVSEVCQNSLPHVMSVESSDLLMEREVVKDEGGKDSPRWPSVVRSEYAARMEELWRKCGERLGREVRGGRWWV